MAGYSGTSLVRKLGIKDGFRIYVKNAPANYSELIQPIPENVKFLTRPSSGLDMIHLFASDHQELVKCLTSYLDKIKPEGMIWVSWPKKATSKKAIKIPTDITEDRVRDAALPMGLVDIKVCAVDETWSGLKLVIRKENRGK